MCYYAVHTTASGNKKGIIAYALQGQNLFELCNLCSYCGDLRGKTHYKVYFNVKQAQIEVQNDYSKPMRYAKGINGSGQEIKDTERALQ